MSLKKAKKNFIKKKSAIKIMARQFTIGLFILTFISIYAQKEHEKLDASKNSDSTTYSNKQPVGQANISGGVIILLVYASTLGIKKIYNEKNKL